MIKEALRQVAEGHDLSRAHAREVMDHIMRGEATPAQIGAFLVALRMKGETPEEIAGSAEAMRVQAVPVRPSSDGVIDTAGTGGDGAGTINLSTAAALVATAAGARVAKHGNRAVSSACGSADVLEALGFDLELEPDAIARSIDELGFGFLYAPAHHPAMRHAGAVRRELATRTVFNVLGPLTNPAGARRQLLGVYSEALVETITAVLAILETERALVVHGAGGIDELSPAGPNLVHEVADGEVRIHRVEPEDFGVTRCDPADLAGGTPEENAATVLAIFDGHTGPKRDAVLMNAAGALFVAGLAADLAEGFALAADAVDSGAAGERVVELAAFTRSTASRSSTAKAAS